MENVLQSSVSSYGGDDQVSSANENSFREICIAEYTDICLMMVPVSLVLAW